jgi:hypothetical protein
VGYRNTRTIPKTVVQQILIAKILTAEDSVLEEMLQRLDDRDLHNYVISETPEWGEENHIRSIQDF